MGNTSSAAFKQTEAKIQAGALPAAYANQHVEIGLDHRPIDGAIGQVLGKHARYQQHAASSRQGATAVAENLLRPRIVPVVQHALEHTALGSTAPLNANPKPQWFHTGYTGTLD
jgi:hypothetical protein